MGQPANIQTYVRLTADTLAFKAMSDILNYGDIAVDSAKAIAVQYSVGDEAVIVEATAKVRAAIPVGLEICK